LETVQGTTVPLDTGRDTSPVPRPPGPPDAPPTTPLAKLAEADRHLLAIGAEVATLREELARLREEAGERAQLLAERDAVIAELSGLLPALEQARIEAVRDAEGAHAALTRAESRSSAQAGRLAELERRLATVDASTAANERAVAELEARLTEERSKREGAESSLAEAVGRTRSVEQSFAEARTRLEALTGDHERLLAERLEERALAERRSDETASAIRASESRLARETERAEALERERRNLENALSERVAGLSALEAKLARARSEHEDAKAVDPERPQLAAVPSSSTHLRFVVRAGGYTVSECDGELPRVGQVIEVDGERFVVSKTGPSPLPSDPRSCAYLLVELGSGSSG
jgi:DNA repair exonuclease SbcCD ATPase subunit